MKAVRGRRLRIAGLIAWSLLLARRRRGPG